MNPCNEHNCKGYHGCQSDGGCQLLTEWRKGEVIRREMEILLMFHAELKRAEGLHEPMVSVHHGAHVMWREFRELSDAIAANKMDVMDADVAKECSHVGAMALRFLKDLGGK